MTSGGYATIPVCVKVLTRWNLVDIFFTKPENQFFVDKVAVLDKKEIMQESPKIRDAIERFKVWS